MSFKKVLRRSVASVCLLLCILFTNAQVRTKSFRNNIPQELLPVNRIINKTVDLIAPTEFVELKSKKSNPDGIDNRFASSLPVNIDFISNATIVLNEKFKVYTLKINAKEALNISIEFGNFILSDNAILSIYTDKELTDSITSLQNNPANVWATRVYQGSYLNIVLKEPINQKEVSRLRISKVNFGYKDIGIQFGNQGASAGCNVNVACAAGNGWNEERNSIAMIIANGDEVCSGALIMNTCGTNIPYLLTANHCLQAGNVGNWVFQFQYWSTTCVNNNGMNEDVQFNGCQLRASSAATDFALLQLNQTPTANSGIRYAGWSRLMPANGSLITNATILHHPKGDVMKISVDNQTPTQQFVSNAQCWILNLDIGATEGGSSGAPYFNQNRRIIGQHYGSFTNNTSDPCNQPTKFGGRFDLSWAGGGTNATRLSNWLDPGNTNALVMNTTNIASLTSPLATAFPSISGPLNFCTGSGNYGISNLPANTSVSWTSSNTSVATITSSGATATLTKVSEGTVTITATITQCGTTIVRTKTVTMGFPYFYNPVNGADTATPYGHYTFSQPLPYSYPTASYYWRVPTGWTILFGQGTSNVYVEAGGMGEGGPVEVDVTACGITRLNHKYVEIGSSNCNGCLPDRPSPGGDKFGYTVKVSPNPARNTAMVTLMPANEKVKNSSYSIQQIKIADKMGSIKKQLSFNNRQLTQTININGLPPDIYVVSVYDGHYWQNVKLIVQ